MLEKQASNLNVEKLQIILLFKVDFNENNKWLGWAVMFNMESYHQLGPKQYGSHKKKIGGYPMPQQKVTIQSCPIHAQTSGNLLK